MKKLTLSICLVAGTAVGVGMIALPMALCKIGIFPTIALILIVWFFMYISSLLGTEINLRAGYGFPIGKLANLYSGRIASIIGNTSFILLIYALLCAYIYGGASVLESFFVSYLGWSFSLKKIVLTYAFLLSLLLIAPVKSILRINRFLFINLLFFLGFLVLGLLYKTRFSHLPLIEVLAMNIKSWTEAIPILSTSFGFQVVLHTLTNFCDKDPVLLKRAIFWGSLIPAIVYIIWTVSTLGILYHYAPYDYQKLLTGELEVGQFIQALAKVAPWQFLQIFISVISIIAIAKSSINLGLALFEAWQEQFHQWHSKKPNFFKGISIVLTIVIPLIIALFVPQLFLKALKFAGMVSIIIAVLIPLWLITRPKAQGKKVFYTLTQYKSIRIMCLIFGLMVVLCEAINITIK